MKPEKLLSKPAPHALILLARRIAEMSTAIPPKRLELDHIAHDSWYAQSVPAAMIRHTARLFRRYFRGRRCLELGPAEGLMTPALASAFPDLTLVDGAAKFCEGLRTRFPRATVVNTLFEEFTPDDPFDTIVLGHVLEHVDSPSELLRKVAGWLAPGGVVCCSAPNARSLHRQAAVIMGLLQDEYGMSDADRHHGHQRIYNPELFRAEFLRNGFRIETFGGYWLKPLSNAQLESWTPEMVDAFMQLGERYPDIAAELYVVASVKESI